MPIEIASNNHIGVVCQKISKLDLKHIKKNWLMWHTLLEWKGAVQDGGYQDHDCDGVWGCEYENEKYAGSIGVRADDAEDSSQIPTWATHVMWSSK